jgi:hypothetical protein
MKTHFVIIILILVGVLSFIIGYSMAPTDVSVVRHSVQQAPAASGGGHGESGGYGSAAPASGGYGAAPAASGGYGAAPASGGYGGQ